MNKEIKAKWVKALRSGQYKQGRNKLRSANNEFCCLGVLCNLHAEAHPEIAAQHTNPRSYIGNTQMPPTQVCLWANIYIWGNPYATGDVLLTLATMNDTGKSFKEIADFIEKEL
jgi:hypothetical protein